MGLKSNSDDQSPNNSKNTADEAALEFTKQLITLASGALVLSATFIEKIGELSFILLFMLGLSWIVLLISVVFGLETISAIVKSRLENNNNWSEGYGKKSARISKYGFVIGISLFVIFAFLSISSNQQKFKDKQIQKSSIISDSSKKVNVIKDSSLIKLSKSIDEEIK